MWRALEKTWWQTRKTWFAYVLLPFVPFYWCVSRLRQAYLKRQQKSFLVPVVVIGNITVGGNGKTPFLIALAKALRQAGFSPGIVSRGYSAKTKTFPFVVRRDHSALLVGDEPLMLAKKTECPVVISPNRQEAINHLLANFPCDIVLSDDGLSHYAMHRDIEIILMDSQHQLGNQLLLPAGPLREPRQRLNAADFIVSDKASDFAKAAYTLKMSHLYFLQDNKPVSIEDLKGQPLTAISAIAKPTRFFKLLRSLGLAFTRRTFQDHHAFSQEDVKVDEGLILMTEKDAVKCIDFAENIVVLAIDFELAPAFWQDFSNTLSQKTKKRLVTHNETSC